MDTKDNQSVPEMSDSGYPIEIYTDERIREFLAEDRITPEEKNRIDEKLAQPKIRKP